MNKLSIYTDSLPGNTRKGPVIALVVVDPEAPGMDNI